MSFLTEAFQILYILFGVGLLLSTLAVLPRFIADTVKEAKQSRHNVDYWRGCVIAFTVIVTLATLKIAFVWFTSWLGLDMREKTVLDCILLIR